MLEQWFPTGGSPTPGGPKQHFWGSEMRFSSVRVSMLLLEVRFFKITKIYEILQVLLLKRTLSSLNIPANVAYLQIKLVNVYLAANVTYTISANVTYAISASRCGRIVNGFHVGVRTQNHKLGPGKYF